MNMTDNKSCIQKAQRKHFKKFTYLTKKTYFFVCNVLYTVRVVDWKCTIGITNITIVK